MPNSAIEQTIEQPIDDVVRDVRRVVPLDAVHNFRDLGGYRLDDGRVTTWGRIFRADGLQRLTDDDLAVIDAVGIRTVIDLRTTAEIRDRGTFPVDKMPVDWHHLSIIDATWHDTGIPDFDDDEQGGIDFLVWAYRDMLEQGADRFAHAITLLSRPAAAPAVFHCAAGKDRTGLLAALILGGLGVDHDVIAADYGLTVDGMARLKVWLADIDPQALDDMNGRPAMMFGSHPAAMRQILAEMVEAHGSVRHYLAGIGVGAAVLDDLATQLTSSSARVAISSR